MDETRPLRQGGRLTAWELGEMRVPYRLICDAMGADLMARGKVNAVWISADRMAANGDVANKIGTYKPGGAGPLAPCAVLRGNAHTTCDASCPSSDAVPIEQRDAAEVTGVSGSFSQCRWAPADAEVYNPAFDVTPAALIDGWVLDTGIVTPQQVGEGLFSRSLRSEGAV